MVAVLLAWRTIRPVRRGLRLATVKHDHLLEALSLEALRFLLSSNT
jgi:hypothetical protein